MTDESAEELLALRDRIVAIEDLAHLERGGTRVHYRAAAGDRATLELREPFLEVCALLLLGERRPTRGGT